jgi:hypothetical protein
MKRGRKKGGQFKRNRKMGNENGKGERKGETGK